MKYCVVKLDEKKAAAKVKRYQAIALSAAKQSKRSIVPHVHEVLNWNEALAYAKEKTDLWIVPYENERGMESVREALQALDGCNAVSVFIGPEGGFSAEEIEMIRPQSQVISLGNRILRTDTAAITTMSLLMLSLEQSSEGKPVTS